MFQKYSNSDISQVLNSENLAEEIKEINRLYSVLRSGSMPRFLACCQETQVGRNIAQAIAARLAQAGISTGLELENHEIFRHTGLHFISEVLRYAGFVRQLGRHA